MLLKSIIIFVICNYMREILNINLCKVYVNCKSLFIEWQYYKFMSLAQGSLVGFCSIVGRCHSGWWEWDLGTLAQFQ